MIRDFLERTLRGLPRLFLPRYLYWHILAITLTVLLVTSGTDWQYFLLTRQIHTYGLIAAVAGFLLPFLAPAYLYICGMVSGRTALKESALVIASAEALGYLVSIFYKVFSGRIAPDYFSYSAANDLSREFHFGFWGNGIFWGWPSSHTAVAFALAAAVVMLYPRNRSLWLLAGLYAFAIGFGISISIHWFSDFVAGAILGGLAGYIAAGVRR